MRTNQYSLGSGTNGIVGGQRDMVSKKGGEQKIGRDARTGRFIPVKEAERRPSTTVVETIKRKKGK